MTVLEAAIGYHASGLSVIPLLGKVCPVSWSQYQRRHTALNEIHIWHRWGYLRGVGIVCGFISGNLVVIDLDGMDAVREFRETFPDLLDTFTVRTGSGEGQHLYYTTNKLHQTKRTKGFELRSEGAYVVAPPSIHPVTGEAYWVERRVPVKHVPDLYDVARWIGDKSPVRSTPKRTPKPIPTPQGVSDKPKRFVKAYARRALENECSHVSGAAKGTRNDSLYHAARRLGSLLASPDVQAHNALNRSQVERALECAAARLSADVCLPATLRTLRSGIETGLQAPFDLPEPKPLRNRNG